MSRKNVLNASSKYTSPVSASVTVVSAVGHDISDVRVLSTVKSSCVSVGAASKSRCSISNKRATRISSKSITCHACVIIPVCGEPSTGVHVTKSDCNCLNKLVLVSYHSAPTSTPVGAFASTNASNR